MTPTVILEYTNRKSIRNATLSTMATSQIFTKGLSSGFIPEYRHAAETVDESEGFINSGHIDSEDLSAPKRKCISLNTERADCFNVPLEAFSVSSMSNSEKKALKRRLRKELEQIQLLQKKFLPGSVNGVAISSTGDASRKKQLEHERSVRNNAALMKQCGQLLNRLLQHPYAWVFKQPVDAVKLNIPDYYTVIKHPMDLGTIKSKLTSGMYSGPSAFASDVRLTFSNAKTYNPPGNDVHLMAKDLSNLFESKWKLIEKKVLVIDTILSRESEPAKPSQTKKRKASSMNQVSAVQVDAEIPRNGVGTMNRIMDVEEKQKLSRLLEALIPELPDHIIEFLKKSSGNQGQISEDEIEIDIDALGDSTLFELRNLLDDFCSLRKLKRTMKANPREIEVLNESGISNPSNQPVKGNEHQMDEEVDIMGNDHPVSCYPPVEIEKDATIGNSKYSSSSRSTSESGSSSSDSDSSSSSGGESIEAEGSFATNDKVKEATGSVPIFEHEVDNMLDQNRHVSSGSEQPEERGDPSAAASTEADDRTQGGHAPSEREVSPDKLYRAALLRSRFADTILKAREKTLDKADKGDPEKLQRERKELERQKQEEKARLQAEARAAEELRQQVEDRVAAEAKRKRELEREAARQALLEMEKKTVEIGENSRFLKDLEMLGGSADHHLPSSIVESSPGLSLGGSFKLGGSCNPLEQLGLYMKADEDDEEDEEEVEPEEGEID